MPRVQLIEELFYIELHGFAGVQRADALVDILAELTQFLDMREQLPTNLLLVVLREDCDLCQRLFEHLHHAGIIANPNSAARISTVRPRVCSPAAPYHKCQRTCCRLTNTDRA